MYVYFLLLDTVALQLFINIQTHKNNYIHCKQVFKTIYIVEQTVIQNKNLTHTETRCSVLSAN